MNIEIKMGLVIKIKNSVKIKYMDGVDTKNDLGKNKMYTKHFSLHFIYYIYFNFFENNFYSPGQIGY